MTLIEDELAVADHGEHALLELRNISKYFGNVTALENITTRVEAGKVTCVLGDNGAGKSTFIKILSGVHQPSSGEYTMYGTPVHFTTPRDARLAGIAAVFQDLALAPLLSIWRNFFLGVEPMHAGILMRSAFMKKTAKEEMAKMGIDLRDVDQPVGTLSGGERQSVAIARAVYFGARVLILDEPTSALGVKQSGVVLKYTRRGRTRSRRDLHHPQPESCDPRRRSVLAAQPRAQPWRLRQGRDLARPSSPV